MPAKRLTDVRAQARGASLPAEPGRALPEAILPADVVIPTSHADIAVRQSAGRKLPTLFIHDGSSCKGVFASQFDSAIGQEYHLIAMDLPGHGASGNAFDPERTYCVPGYADAAVEVLEQLGIDQVAVVGWSLGGLVAMEMMALYPDLVGLMVVGAAPVGSGAEAIGEGLRDNPSRALAAKPHLTDAEIASLSAMLSGGADDPEFRAAVGRADGAARALTAASLLAGNVSDQRRLVATSAIPLAIVCGAAEPFIDTDYLDGLAYGNLWRGKCHLIPRAGHAPFLEAPQLFNGLLSRFLKAMEGLARHRLRHPQLVYSA
jgi:pimeloyl-ACP methyl ester carboxylesterase